MTIDFPGFAAPAVGLDTPLALLSACHDRITRQCNTLRRLAVHVVEHGADAPAQTAAVSLLRYFDTAAVLHHRDEEEDLFPLLIDAMSGSDATCIHAIVKGLTQEHRQLEATWHVLRQALSAISMGQAVDLRTADVEAFYAGYTAHIRREEDELLPMAARCLDDAALADLSLAMKGRRGGGVS